MEELGAKERHAVFASLDEDIAISVDVTASKVGYRAQSREVTVVDAQQPVNFVLSGLRCQANAGVAMPNDSPATMAMIVFMSLHPWLVGAPSA